MYTPFCKERGTDLDSKGAVPGYATWSCRYRTLPSVVLASRHRCALRAAIVVKCATTAVFYFWVRRLGFGVRCTNETQPEKRVRFVQLLETSVMEMLTKHSDKCLVPHAANLTHLPPLAPPGAVVSTRADANSCGISAPRSYQAFVYTEVRLFIATQPQPTPVGFQTGPVSAATKV